MKPGDVFNPYRTLIGIYIPEAVTSHHQLSMGAKIVYGRLLRYAGSNGFCYPAVRALAREVGVVSERQVQRYLRELQDFGFIGVIPWFVSADGDDRKRQTSNRYLFLWHESFDSNPLLSVPNPLVPQTEVRQDVEPR